MLFATAILHGFLRAKYGTNSICLLFPNMIIKSAIYQLLIFVNKKYTNLKDYFLNILSKKKHRLFCPYLINFYLCS